MNSLAISIIIPTYNRPEELRQCLTALLAQPVSPDEVEILISDDSKNTATKELIEKEFPSVQWHEGPHKGPACNRNSGAKVARGKWLIFIDDDCLPRPGLIEAYQKAIAETQGEEIILEGPTVRIGEPSSMLWEAPHNPDGGHLISANLAVPRALFSRMNGFDETFSFAFEDMEFAARSKAMGIPSRFVPDAGVDHPLRRRRSPRNLANQWESRVISSYYFGAKPWQVLYYLPRHVLLVMLSRFRGKRMNKENLQVMMQCVVEFFLFAAKLPQWCQRYRHCRSSFWSDPKYASAVPRRFGL